VSVRRRELLLAIGSLAWGCRRASEPDASKRGEAASPSPSTAAAPNDPLGSLGSVPAELWPAFDRAAHRPAPAQLASDGEPPQSYADFLAEAPARPGPARRTLAILPIGEYPRGFVVEYERTHLVRSPEPALLGRFCEAWFGLPIRILPALTDDLLERMPARERDGHRQLDAAPLLAWLSTMLPADCFCMLALTLEDLYQAGAAWVFGLASIDTRVGVHSMLRYDPGFANADARPPDFERTISTRALRVVVHETAHMFGLRHCVHFACVMNPTTGLADLDALPLDLCPVCLRKLWTATGVSLESRWRKLAELAQTLDLEREESWYSERLAALSRPRQSNE
jgi:archaemetzincin